MWQRSGPVLALALLAGLAGLLGQPSQAGQAAPSPVRASPVAWSAAAGPAGPAVCGTSVAAPGSVFQAVPWHQNWFDPDRIGPLGKGTGQVVAVIDTGVDAGHEQLRGHVLAGFDELRMQPGGNVDCAAHGTAVASLIAAQKTPETGFRGLAPGARIMPLRVSNSAPAIGVDGEERASVRAVSRAITWAVRHGATVIEVSPAFRVGDLGLRTAVNGALRQGIPVIAAVGDYHNSQLPVDPPTYPAAYRGVIGVGALDSDFLVWNSSNIGDDVDLTAPGAGVIADARAAGQQTWNGTSIAAGLVAATVALVRQARPELTPAQIADRIAITADPVPGGQLSAPYGAGLLDPYRAMTESMTDGQTQAITGISPPPVDLTALARQRARHQARHTALIVAAAGLGLLLLILAAAFVVPRARRRQWRPSRVGTPAQSRTDPVDAEAEDPFALPDVR